MHTPEFLAHRSIVSVTGADAETFLNGIVTVSTTDLAAGELRYGALLTPQGRLLYDLFVVGRQDGAWLDVARQHREALILRLTMYRLRAKVTIAADEAPVFAAWDADPGADWLPDPRLPALGWRGYDIAVTADADEIAYDAHRLALGVPGPADWGVEKSYPIEANFDLLHGIDFKKGCFVGQETTSRMKRRGQIKNRILPLAFDGAPPPPGAELLLNGERRAGEVLSGQPGRAIALVRLDRLDGDLAAEGIAVRAETPDWLKS